MIMLSSPSLYSSNDITTVQLRLTLPTLGVLCFDLQNPYSHGNPLYIVTQLHRVSLKNAIFRSYFRWLIPQVPRPSFSQCNNIMNHSTLGCTKETEKVFKSLFGCTKVSDFSKGCLGYLFTATLQTLCPCCFVIVFNFSISVLIDLGKNRIRHSMYLGWE